MFREMLFNAIGVMVLLSVCLGMLMLFMAAALSFVKKAEAIPPAAPAYAAPLQTEAQPPPAPAFAKPKDGTKAVATPRKAVATATQPAEADANDQESLASALLEHLEAQGYEFDPGPALGR